MPTVSLGEKGIIAHAANQLLAEGRQLWAVSCPVERPGRAGSWCLQPTAERAWEGNPPHPELILKMIAMAFLGDTESKVPAKWHLAS